MNTRKKTTFGILGATATAALALGVSAPAMADDHDSSTDYTQTSSYTKVLNKVLGDVGFSNESPVVVAPEVLTGDVHTGDVLSGNANGNHVGSGNVIGSGNDTAIGSGNHTAIDGVDVDASDFFDSTVGDITGDVSDLLDDIDVSLDNMFED
jgi:hypothetical protein